MDTGNDSPKVSVILPVYNSEKFLISCLNSIMMQSFRDFEVIAVDDCSTDGSFRILNEFAAKDSRFQVIRNYRNFGVSYSLNRAIKHSSANILIRMDSDDVMVIDRIALQYEYFQKHPDCVVLGGQVVVVDTENRYQGKLNFPPDDSKIRKKIYYIQTVADSTLAFNRRLIPENVFLFDTDLIVAEGLDLYFRLMPYGRFFNMRETLLILRQRKDSLSGRFLRTYLNIVRVRLRAVFKYHVKASIFIWPVLILQGLIVFIFPKKIVLWICNLFKFIFLKEPVVGSNRRKDNIPK